MNEFFFIYNIPRTVVSTHLPISKNLLSETKWSSFSRVEERAQRRALLEQSSTVRYLSCPSPLRASTSYQPQGDWPLRIIWYATGAIQGESSEESGLEPETLGPSKPRTHHRQTDWPQLLSRRGSNQHIGGLFENET
ncbi:hypothetical protein AVEN_241079-1 [Araneus ventricosus]|uniref:Uncharacterized protein n=1 Tax=Araneus ventricosus TaxID=182803 RepID=A0A4Y2LMB2_ARAVE|nr:hypothetical protein AVEN_241079-1 [Araneus ventricosus]